MNLTKSCFKCGKEKTLNNFYKHKEMSLGVVNKCKECNKRDVRENYKKKSKDIAFIERERERSREKYHRLNYKDKQKEWDKSKPWKSNSIYKSLRKSYRNLPKTHHLHHWNYNDDFLKDIIIIDRFEHRKAHELIKLDLSKRIYITLSGAYLDTKEKHINYLKSKGIKIK